MTRNDRILERLRAVNPAPGKARIDPNEISTISSLLEERRDAVTTQTPIRPRTPTNEERRRLRPVLAFGIALAVIGLSIGMGILVLGGGEEDVVEPSQTTLPTPTTAPAPTTTPTTAPTEVDPPIVAQPYETVIAERLQTMVAMTGTDGHPIFLGEVGTDTGSGGSLRLVRCTDPGCLEEPEVVDIVSGIEWQGNLVLAPGPDGHPLIGYRSGVDPDGTTFNAYTNEYLPTRQIYSVLYCSDDACQEFDRYEVGSTAVEALMVGGWTFTDDGLPLYTYVLGPPNETTMHVVACADRGCEDVTDTEIDSAPFLRDGGPVRITQEGGLLTVYSASTPTGPPGVEGGWDEAPYRHEVRAAYCAEPTCSIGAVVTTLGQGTLPLPMSSSDGSVLVKFMSTEEGEELFASPVILTSVHCVDSACTSFTSTNSAPLPGTPWPWASWTYDPAGHLAWAVVEEIMGPGMVDGEEGPEPGEVPVGTRLAYSHCMDVTCSSIKTIELPGITDIDDWLEVHVLFSSSGQPMVTVNDAAGIYILRPLER